MSTAPQAELSLVTVGALAVQLQVSVPAVRRALRAIGARPALLLNGMEHYDEEAVVDACRQWLKDR